MKRTPLYSRSRAPAPAAPVPDGDALQAPTGSAAANAPFPPHQRASSFARNRAPGVKASTPQTGAFTRQDSAGTGSAGSPGAIAPRGAPSRFTLWCQRHERRLWALGLAVAALGWGLSVQRTGAGTPGPTAEQLAEFIRKDIVEKPLPSPASAAYAAIRGSVVRVIGLDGEKPESNGGESQGDGIPRNVGTGVVIVENGTILTNLHVVQGARRLKVTFADGSESDAVIVGSQPENDLAVLRAKTIPDDLKAATLRSTSDLLPGDEVLAVGFPFGIGPSASAGIVSGLKREFRSPDGQQMISNLIQFDSAANPGNSGGPLVTMDGAVVGIVTAILNPSKQRVFIGIGFAVPIENAAAAAGMPPF